MSELIFGLDMEGGTSFATWGFRDDRGVCHIVGEGRSILTDHQAYALAEQIYDHLGYRPPRQCGKTEFGHRVANLVMSLATLPGTGSAPRRPPLS